MPGLESQYELLSDEAKHRLQLFYDRYCRGPLYNSYGLGHLVYACHASFPLLLSPELANLIWVNFKNYHLQNSDDIGQSDLVAVSDLLQSPLCRQIGFQRYEIYPEIRSFLLFLLAEGSGFMRFGLAIEGRERITDLAHFLQQYLQLKIVANSPDGAGFRQINEWAVQAWLTPRLLARELTRAFQTNAKGNNEHGQLWLATQMDKLKLQYERNVKSDTLDDESLYPFYRIYYYGKARAEQLLDNGEKNVFRYSEEIGNFVDTGSVEDSPPIQLPLLRSAAERTERKINNIQRVFVLYDEVELLQGRTQEIILKYAGSNKIELEFETPVSYEIDFKKSFRRIKHQIKEEDILFLLNFDQISLPPEELFGQKFGTVAILTAAAGHFIPPKAGKILILATRTAISPDEAPNAEDAKALIRYILDILEGLHGAISYKDLFQLLLFKHTERVYIKLSYVPDYPMILAIPGDFNKQFLTAKRMDTDNYYLLCHSEAHQCWIVIDEDFTIIRLNGQALVYDYVSDVPVPSVRGEIFNSRIDNFLQFGGFTEPLETKKFYKVQTQRDALKFEISVEFSGLDADNESPAEAIRNSLDSLHFDVFSRWGDMEEGSREWEDKLLINLKPSPAGILSEITYRPAGDKQGYSWTLPNREEIAPSIGKFARYEYLRGLSLPAEHYVQYRTLDTKFIGWWAKPGYSPGYSSGYSPGYTSIRDTSLRIDRHSIYFADGKINFYPIMLEIDNDEGFQIFFDVYLLRSDFSIRKISGPGISFVMPYSDVKWEFNDPALLKQIIREGGSAEIKVLMSCDPMQHDFSQTGIQRTK